MTSAASDLAGAPQAAAPGAVQVLAANLYALLLVGGIAAAVWIWRGSRQGRIDWRAGARVLVGRPFTWLDLLWVVAIVLTCSGLVGYVHAAVAGEDAPTGARAIVLTSLAVHWPALAAIAVLVALRRGSWGRAFGWRAARLGADVRRGLVAFVAMTPIVFGLLALNWLLLRALGIQPELQDVATYLLEDAAPLVTLYKGFTAVVLAPVAEELLFRGVALPVLAQKLNPLGGMIAVSLLFAAVHGQFSVMLPLFVVSLCFCAAYQATQSIVVPVVMHMLFNGVNLALMSVFLDHAA